MKNVTFSYTGTCYDVTYLWVIALSAKVVGATSSEGFSGYKMNANRPSHHTDYTTTVIIVRFQSRETRHCLSQFVQ